jgi:hypothetical protein
VLAVESDVIQPTPQLVLERNGEIVVEPDSAAPIVHRYAGSVRGLVNARFALVLSSFGLNGVIETEEAPIYISMPAEAPAGVQIVCSQIHVGGAPRSSFESEMQTLGPGSGGQVYLLAVIDYRFYSLHTSDYIAWVSAFVNHMDYSDVPVQVTTNTAVVSTCSPNCDTAIGVADEECVADIIQPWAEKTSERSDTGSWDAAFLVSGRSGCAANGLAYSPGRYFIIQPESYDSSQYQYVNARKQLAAHEFGHLFNLDDTDDYYIEQIQNCQSPVYFPNTPPIPAYTCIGEARHCDSPEIGGLCVDRATPKDVEHDYLMNGQGTFHYTADWANWPDIVWDPRLQTFEYNVVNVCLVSWHAIPYDPLLAASC